MVFDCKKEYREFYLPKNRPETETVPATNYIAVQGCGDPYQEGNTYQQAISLLYAAVYTLKMSYKGSHRIEGFYEYSLPSGWLWRQENTRDVDLLHKESFYRISVILPGFVTPDDFA